jgi:hypothetical protein
MATNNYGNLFMAAGITRDQDKYERCLDAVLEHEDFSANDIIGVGEQGFYNGEFYVVFRDRVMEAAERGVFNKRIEVYRRCTVPAIAELLTTREGFKGTEFTITAKDKNGETILRIVWGLPREDWEASLLDRQRGHLVALIGAAMDEVGSGPVQVSVASAASKAGALMDWAGGVVKASGVEVTAQRVEEHANMAAGGIRFMVFLRLGAPLGIDDLNMFYPTGREPDGKPIETFDRLYAGVVARVGNAQVVDSAIDELLAGSWSEFVRGCRETYS